MLKKYLLKSLELLTLVVGGALVCYALYRSDFVPGLHDEVLRFQGYGEMDIVHAQHKGELR